MKFSELLYRSYDAVMKRSGFDYQIRQFIFDNTDKNIMVESILEVGCGTGVTGLTLLELFPSTDLVLTDKNIDLLDKLNEKKTKNNTISLGVSDISDPKTVSMLSGVALSSEKIQITDESFDIICAGANIGYSSNPESSLSSLYDILKPGGYIIDLEMSLGFWGRVISMCYDYPVLSLSQINDSVASKGGIVTLKKIPWRYFPVNLTRVFITITKP